MCAQSSLDMQVLRTERDEQENLWAHHIPYYMCTLVAVKWQPPNNYVFFRPKDFGN